jgi:hypothetical protein
LLILVNLPWHLSNSLTAKVRNFGRMCDPGKKFLLLEICGGE